MADYGFVFPGQASQYVGMGGFIFERFPKTQDFLKEADNVLGFKLSELIKYGPMEELTKTENCQPAILTVSVAFSQVLKDKGFSPAILAGHSLGEYSALVYAKSMSFADAVRLVRLRGKYMQEAVPLGEGAMAAIIGLDAKKIEEICTDLKNKGVVEPANYNSPVQTVIAGEAVVVEEAMKIAKEKGAKLVKKLDVSAPFHSSLLKPAGDKLAKDLVSVETGDPWIPYVDNYKARIMTKANVIKEALEKQVYNKVLWEQCVREMKREFHITRIVEVGPGKVLTGLIKKIDPTLECIVTDDEGGFVELLERGL